ncbi:uncharacterized protein LOC126564597 [Anopheles maculipalpis]|uniref:uncharacterized protein LOC126564597 n=1 Tax=Anopheles maculipalpis TaxID=1496333 RepID=UPI002158D0CB|nr:uncharacterized protein LOC126564597 [Anopheles maculipalpis]
MKAFCFTLTILCAVQSILALPRPDFGINGAVSGTAQFKTAGLELDAAITKVGSGTVTLTSGYQLLKTIADNLEYIGDLIVIDGGNFARALDSLAADNSGGVANAFDFTISKLDAFSAVLSGNFGGKLAAIATDTGDYIGKQFADAFKAAGTTLTALKAALNTLKTDVQNAKNAAGSSSTVSNAIIRAKIPAKSVNNVITQVRQLRANMPLIGFVIDSSLDNLKMVDTFVVDMKEEIVRGVAAYALSISGFKLNLETEGINIYSKFTTTLGVKIFDRISTLSSNLNAVTKYTQSLLPAISALNTAFYSSPTTKINQLLGGLSTYRNEVPNIISNLETPLGDALCSPIKAVSLVQIANAGYSDFCFSKHSPRVFAQVALTLDAFDVCFEKEVTRLLALETIAVNVAQQIAYTGEDVFDNLSICLALPDANKGACFELLTPYYNILAGKAEAHLTTFANLGLAEAKASFNRLGSCLYVSLSLTTIAATEIASTATSCLTAGPQP